MFRSPRCLNLRLFCTPQTPARDMLDLWPALPLIVAGTMDMVLSPGTDNIIAALGPSNRVCEFFLWDLARRQLEKVLAAMQVPFPELKELRLFSYRETVPVIPDSFLNGSAQRLRIVDLYGIPYPGLPNLLLSASHLVDLHISNIPHSGYISPQAIVAVISVLSSLRSLIFEFRSPQPHPDWESQSLSSPKRYIFPVLHEFRFKGVTGYLEELVTPIDTPQLAEMHVTFFNQIDFDCPRLAQFINCTPTLGVGDEACVVFYDNTASVELPAGSESTTPTLTIAISCREPDLQLSSIAQVCNSSLPPPSTVEDLYIEHKYSQLVWKNDAIENTLWLELLLPFAAVKDLYLSKEFVPDIATTLQELVGDRITEVLPSLQNIFVEGLQAEPSGPLQENIWQFAGVRRQSGFPPLPFLSGIEAGCDSG